MRPEETFLEEARELLQELTHALLELEQRPEDQALLDTAFRSLHTIKGSGNMFDFRALVQFAHALETAFVEFRDHRAVITHDIITVSLEAVDHLGALLDVPEGSADLNRVSDDLLTRFTAAMGGVSGFTASPRTVDHAPPSESMEGAVPTPGRAVPAQSSGGTIHAFRIEYRPSPATFLNGTDPLGLIGELRSLGTCVVLGYTSAIPPLGKLEPEHCYLSWDILLATTAPAQAIHDVFIFLDADSRVQIDHLDEVVPSDDEERYKRLGEILVERGDVSREELERIVRDRPPLGTVLVREGVVSEDAVQGALEEQKFVKSVRSAARTIESVGTIKVKSERLEKLVNLVGEFVSLHAQMTTTAMRRADRDFLSLTEQMERLVRETRDLAIELQMVPVDTLFVPLQRFVRDTSVELGKRIELVVRGADTELDKNIIDALRDPLMHIVRNSIDHGIESAERRLTAGKPEVGTIEVSAGYAGAMVRISIRDDGGGINVEKVRQRAVDRGLISADQELSDAKIRHMIFAPGFSTAEVATQLSGRGVGMDVVKQNVERLNGRVVVDSATGSGTCITLDIPLTLAIVEGLLARVGEEFYLLNLNSIVECVDGKATSASLHGSAFNYRGAAVPLIDLRRYMRVHNAASVIDSCAIVVVRTDEGLYGLVVDELFDKYQSVIKPLGRMFSQVEGLSGAVLLGDGTPALMIDTERLCRAGVASSSVV